MGFFTSLFRKKPSYEETRYILSIDGGGIRGIIPATILSFLQDTMKSFSQSKQIGDYFDLISGNSTGGIIALALASSKTNSLLSSYEDTQRPDIARIKEMYSLYAKDIFPSSSLNPIRGSFKAKYSHRPLESFLTRAFEDQKLRDSHLPVMVLSYDMISGQPFIISSDENNNINFIQAARATSAAPTYFKPLNLKYENNDYSLIDGGIIANNPVIFSYLKAKELYPKATKFVILSLGTCSSSYSYGSVSPNSAIGWMDLSSGMPLLTKVYATTQMQQTSIMAKSLSDALYIRINGSIDGDKISMDSTRSSDIQRLEETAQKIINDNENTLISLCADLIRNKAHE